MSNPKSANIKFAVYLGTLAVGTVVTAVLVRKLFQEIAALMNGVSKSDIEKTRKNLAIRLKRPELEVIELTSYEAKLCESVVAPEEIRETFQSIGGLESEIEDVHDHVILPMQMWKMFKGQSNMSPCPTGVLLYGEPGTGKTLMAKAIAKESGATFINIKASSIMDKYYGETDKLVSALFGLARKLAPSVLFIDEIDTVLKKRGAGADNSPALHSMQGVFLAEWDGLQQLGNDSSSANDAAAPVVVVGATNRPSDLDKAFLRRMPVSIRTQVPNEAGRRDILTKMLADETVDESVDVSEVARRTPNFTGSDLRELVRVAALQRMKALVAATKLQLGTNTSTSTLAQPNMPLTAEYFEYALGKAKLTNDQAVDFDQELNSNHRRDRSVDSNAALAAILSLMGGGSN